MWRPNGRTSRKSAARSENGPDARRIECSPTRRATVKRNISVAPSRRIKNHFGRSNNRTFDSGARPARDCQRGRRNRGVSLTGFLNLDDHWFPEPEAVAPLTQLAEDFTVKKPAMKSPLG